MKRNTGAVAVLCTCALALAGCSLNFNLPALAAGKSVETQRLEHALEINDANPHAWFLLGKAQLDSNRPEAAVDSFRRALKIQPDFEEAGLGLGVAYLQQHRFAAAERAFSRTLERAPESHPALEGIAAAELGRGHLDASEAAAKRALALAPRSPQAHRLLGEVAYIRGDYAVAIEHWDVALGDGGELAAELHPVADDLRQYLDKYGTK